MQTKFRIGIVSASLLSILVLAMGPVAAEGDLGDGDKSVTSSSLQSSTDGDDNGSDVDKSTSTTSQALDGREGGASLLVKSEAMRKGIEQRRTHIKERAQELLTKARENHKQHSQIEKQRYCEAHQKAINSKVANISRQAQKHLAVFDGIFAKVQVFQTEHKLNAANYDSLVAAATDKQTAAIQAVEALKEVSVTVDCSSAKPAESLSQVKAAAENTRDALKDYRTAIKNVISALSAADAVKTSDGGSEQ